MVRAEELRIRNIVRVAEILQMFRDETSVTISPSKLIDVESISVGRINIIYEDAVLQGEPITEEWLLKFGFETMDAEEDLMEYAIDKDGTYIFSILNDGGLQGHSVSPFYITSQGQLHGWAHDHKIEIKYVHQLQNLYFSLCGEELTIK